MSWHRAKATFTEKGQILVMAALVMLVLMALIGLAIDLGRIFVARAQLVRAVDAAALAGTLELPDVPAAQAKVYAYMTENDPDADIDVPISPAERQIQVNGSKEVPMFFIKIFGVESVEVTASATAGFGVLAVDTVLTIDRTISMQGTPLAEAKEAASNFTDVLLSDSIGASETLVGVVPYSNCYKPPKIWDWWGYCTPDSMVVDLSGDKSEVLAGIDDITANGSTNICLGLYKAGYGGDSVLWGPEHHTVSNAMHIVVLLSDGQNWYTGDSYESWSGQPPVECRPITSPSQSDPHTGEDPSGSMCYDAQPRQRELDVKTYDLVDAMKDDGVEVFVVGFDVCGEPNDDECDPDIIGDSYHDNTTNRNLLKCLASSMPGTNDHYFEVETAEELPDTFATIARLIGFRLIR